VNWVNVWVMSLKSCYFDFLKHRRSHKGNSWILRRTCKLCALPAIANFCDSCFVQGLITKLLTFWWNTHRKRLAEVPRYVILIKQGFCLRLLFLACGVFDRSWCASVAWTFNLFIESDWKISFLKFCRECTKPSFVWKSLVVIDRLNINFLVA